MEIGPAVWVAVPAIGGLIGYGTNLIAVRMIFRPIHPVKIFGVTIQGLVGRRQPDLAASIGRVVGSHLLQHEDIVKAFDALNFEKVASKALERGIGPKLAELRRMPLIGSFLTDERIDELKASMLKSFLEHRGELIEDLERAMEEGLDVQQIVEDKVASFPVEQLESLVLEVAARELRSIEVLGFVLGVLIGLLQVGLLYFV